MGGKPSKGTKPDMRLKANNPNAGKSKPPVKTQPPQLKKGN